MMVPSTPLLSGSTQSLTCLKQIHEFEELQENSVAWNALSQVWCCKAQMVARRRLAWGG